MEYKPPKKRAGHNGTIPPESGRFVKGKSGNPNGRPKGTSLTTIIKRVLAEADRKYGTKADALIAMAEKRARKGDFRFFKELIDRNDGKVPDRIANEDGNSLIIKVVRSDVGNRDQS